MAKKRKYEPRIFEGQVMTPADLEQVHKQILGFERIETVSIIATPVSCGGLRPWLEREVMAWLVAHEDSSKPRYRRR